MKHALVVTVVGTDRPGIVERLATLVAEHEGDWLESHMADLAGRFAGIVHVEVAAGRRAALSEALRALGSDELAVTLADGLGESADTAPRERRRELRLELTGLDHPGIVRDVSAALARHEVSVESLETERVSGSMSGEMLFVAHATLALPPALSVETLERTLEEVSSGLMVDVTLDPGD